MPTWWRTAPPQRCRRKVTWSTYRGTCRFLPDHAGACKPTAGKR